MMFSNESGNGVTLNGIATRGNEDFSSDYLIDSATWTDNHFQHRVGVVLYLDSFVPQQQAQIHFSVPK
jgi:hypothetical protein